MAKEGLRVLGFAFRNFPGYSDINEKISEAITLAIANRGKQWAEEVMKFYDIGNCDKINNLFNTMDSNLKQSNIK